MLLIYMVCQAKTTTYVVFSLKKENPSNLRNLVEYLSHDIKKEDGAIFAFAQSVNVSVEDYDNSPLVVYNEFYGSIKDFISLPYYLVKDLKYCAVGENITMGIVRLQKDGLIPFKPKPSHFRKEIFQNWWADEFNFSSNFAKEFNNTSSESSCDKYPNVRDIINDADKMKFLKQYQWAHKVVNDLKTVLNSQYSFLVKAGSPDGQVSAVLDANGTYKELDDYKLHTNSCLTYKTMEAIFLKYFGQ